uniref:Putative ovule protein n=1 Tax=Solanum chacoense TaxID=4108 RepID=A0A0V0I4R9_SOLCH
MTKLHKIFQNAQQKHEFYQFLVKPFIRKGFLNNLVFLVSRHIRFLSRPKNSINTVILHPKLLYLPKKHWHAKERK